MRYALLVLMVMSLAMAGSALSGGASLVVSELAKVADGFRFTEGPMWHAGGYLIFSDIPADTIYRLTDAGSEVVRQPSGNSNGLTFDLQERLIACEHGNRRVSRTAKDGTVAAVATHYDGKRLNSPNDAVVKSDGSVYFTDPPYGVEEKDRELDFQGVYRIGPDGVLSLLVDDFSKPNGLAFSPDEKVLYVADTDKDVVRAFDVRPDGSLANGRVFVRYERPRRLGADGMKVDTQGNLYITAFEGVVIYSPKGEHVETIAMDVRPANLAFGDADGRTLYITAREAVYRVRMRHPGTVWQRRFGE